MERECDRIIGTHPALVGRAFEITRYDRARGTCGRTLTCERHRRAQRLDPLSDLSASLVLGGVGVAGVVVGEITGVMVLGKKGTVDDECDEQKRCTQTGLDAADAGSTLGTVSGIGFIAGGVLLGAGAVLVLTSGGSGKSSDSGSALHLGPGRIAWSGRF